MSSSNSNEISPSHTPVSLSNAPKFGTLVPNRIFVGGIHTDTTETELFELFSNYGSVMATKIIADRAGVSKGYGFVTFETEEEARRIQNEESIILKDRKLNVAPAIKKQPFPRCYGNDLASPDTCSNIEPSETSLSRGVPANANEWNAIGNSNPAEPAPIPNNAIYYSSGIPYGYQGVYNYVPTDPNHYQPYVVYSPFYIPHAYQSPSTPQLQWGGAAFRWPSQVGYEQSNSSPQTSAAATTSSPTVQYQNNGPSTPTSSINAGQRNKTVNSTNHVEKANLYYNPHLGGPQTYTYPMSVPYTIAHHQGMGDSCEASVVENTPTESPSYIQGAYQKGPRKQISNYSPRKGPQSYLAHQSYNSRHYSPQRNYKPRYMDGNSSSQHHVDGKSSGNHASPLTPPATPMNSKSANGSDHITDTTHRFKTLKMRD